MAEKVSSAATEKSEKLAKTRVAKTSRASENRKMTFFGTDFTQSLFSLGLVVISTVGAGMLLARQSGRIGDFPGLLLMVPAAISLRGNVFGTMGARLSTAIHSGTYRRSLSPTSVMGENINASLVLSLWTCLALALLAKGMAFALGIPNTISLDRFIAISVFGGMLASLAALVFSLLVTNISVRFNWNPDNVTAPLVTAAGDLMTIPALLWAASLMNSDIVPTSFTIAVSVAAVLVLFVVWVFGRTSLKTILKESMPILVAAIVIGIFAGYAIERQTSDFLNAPALLILIPSYLAVAGSLGGLLSSQLSTKLHLGMISPAPFPQKGARRDMLAVVGVAIPAFVALAGLTLLGAKIQGLAGASVANVFGVALLGAIPAIIVVLAVSYYGTVVSLRMGVDPDTYGIPVVTSVLDLSSALTIAFIIGILNIT